MVRHGRTRWVAALFVSAITFSSTLLPADVEATTPLSNGATLVVSVPGPLTGCSSLSTSLNASTQAVLDLTLPSAFVTSSKDVPRGANGAIESAELVSLKPMTVSYTIDTKQHWSNGQAFTAADLIAWWHRAAQATTVQSEGYRDIVSMTPSTNGSQVLTVFRSPFAPWNTLFRDVEERGVATSSCSLTSLKSNPSLGPYRVKSASSSSVTLVANPSWRYSLNRFSRVVITTSRVIPKASVPFVAYVPAAMKQSVDDLAKHALVAGHIGATDSVEELQFAPHGNSTATVAARQAWSWLLDRKELLVTLFGNFTFTPSVSPSLLWGQNQQNAPQSPRVIETSTTPTTPALDCLTCALKYFERHGYVVGRGHRITLHGDSPVLVLARGPSAIDQATATALKAQWMAFGITVNVVATTSDQGASALAERGRVDAAVFARPMGMSPWFAATSFLGLRSPDAFSTGETVTGEGALVQQALENFNPVTATSTWLTVDDMDMATYLVRPLFTPPSLTELSPAVTNEAISLSLTGLVDQVTTWGVSSTNK